ncbi:MAG: NAD-dependent epimerase, partial [Candidatus Thorarchaeota archaeon]
LKHRTFNVTAFSFTPAELAEEIKKHIPEFEIDYEPDFRQQIADSWPMSLDDSVARDEWSWKPDYDLPAMVKEMLEKLSKKLGVSY